MKWYKRSEAKLSILLAVSVLFFAVLGFSLKHSVGRYSSEIQETWMTAVPFVLLQGDIVYDLEPRDRKDVLTKEVVIEEKELRFRTVEESYFDTALFIGDSRTVGLHAYAPLGEADYFADVGMSVFNLLDKTIGNDHFTDMTLEGLLESKQYETIYIMLGINEVGYPAASFDSKLEEHLDMIQELQPTATIVLQGNLLVSKKKAEQRPEFSLESMQDLNARIAAMADGQRVTYFDPNSFLGDEEGYLRSDATGDGIHPYLIEYQNWSDWLKNFGVDYVSVGEIAEEVSDKNGKF